MTEPVLDAEIQTETEPKPKLYPSHMIYIGTFMGGPLAAAIMVRRNYLNIGKVKEAKFAIALGVLATAALASCFFILPEDVIDKTPRYVVPAINMLIVGLIVEFKMGGLFREHKKRNGQYYSNWRSAGVSLLAAVIFVGAILGADLLMPASDSFDAALYEKKMTEFTDNENAALKLYEKTDDPAHLVMRFITETGTPKWKLNLEILRSTDSIPNLPAELLERNKLLAKYCSLRIESFDIIYKTYAENTSAYEAALTANTQEIEKVLKELE